MYTIFKHRQYLGKIVKTTKCNKTIGKSGSWTNRTGLRGRSVTKEAIW
jgi:hypothetical protein